MKIKNKTISNIIGIIIILAIALINNTDLFIKTDTEYQTGRVVRVVDGDTAVIRVENKDYKVRFIGVDTPEYNPRRNISDYYGKQASVYSKKELKNKYVYLEKDQSDTDRYGRLLRYIWIKPPENPKRPTYEEIKNNMYNGILVKEGYAKAKYYKPDGRYKDDFEKIEAEAKSSAKGMWN